MQHNQTQQKQLSKAVPFLIEENGQDLVEYSLLLAFIAIAMAAILQTTGTAIFWTMLTAFSQAASALTVANSGGS